MLDDQQLGLLQLVRADPLKKLPPLSSFPSCWEGKVPWKIPGATVHHDHLVDHSPWDLSKTPVVWPEVSDVRVPINPIPDLRIHLPGFGVSVVFRSGLQGLGLAAAYSKFRGFRD